MNHTVSELTDANLEFYNTPKGVMVTYQKNVFLFKDLPEELLEKVEENLKVNSKALVAICNWNITERMAMLEKYVSCRFCGIDFFPDMDCQDNLTPDFNHCPLHGRCKHKGKVCQKLYASTVDKSSNPAFEIPQTIA